MKRQHPIMRALVSTLWSEAWYGHAVAEQCCLHQGEQHIPEVPDAVYDVAGRVLTATELATGLTACQLLAECQLAAGVDPSTCSEPEAAKRFGEKLAYVAIGKLVWFDVGAACAMHKPPVMPKVNLQGLAQQACVYCNARV